MVDAIAPGQQGVLFVAEIDVLSFVVVDKEGRRHRTSALGVALAMARRIAAKSSDAWIVASDGSSLRLTTHHIESAFSRPWISTVIHACEE